MTVNNPTEVAAMCGDWRDLRAGLIAAYPDFYQRPEEERKLLFDAATKFVEAYPPLFVRCVECGEQHHVRSMYRCTDCKGWMCEYDWERHFGPGHRSHR